MISPFPAFPEGKTVKEQVFLEKDLSLPTFFRESRPKNFVPPFCVPQGREGHRKP